MDSKTSQNLNPATPPARAGLLKRIVSTGGGAMKILAVSGACITLGASSAQAAAVEEAPPVPEIVTEATTVQVGGHGAGVPALDFFFQRDTVQNLPGLLDSATDEGVQAASLLVCGAAGTVASGGWGGVAAAAGCSLVADKLGAGALAEAREENKCLRLRLTPVLTADAFDEDPALCRHNVEGSIGVEWMKQGGSAGPLGWATSPAYAVPDASGAAKVQYFQNGLIAWRPGTEKAYSVQGIIAEKYRKLGAEQSILGWPLSSEMDATGADGKVSVFEHGALMWASGSTEAFELHGANWEHFSANGREARFGLPTSDETGPAGGARTNTFSNGCAITYTPGTAGFRGLGTSSNC